MMRTLMKPPLLLIDVSCLAYKAMYSFGDLSYGGVGTAAVYGVLREVLDIMDIHATDRVAWCFDRGYGQRLAINRSYKRKRRKEREDDEEKRAVREELKDQLTALRKNYLPRAGFRNVFSRQGYEADDVIASICHDLPADDSAVIISTDGDLFQLLSHNVIMWLPSKSKPVTAESFSKEHGVSPSQWADVKAIAGCPTDNVEGVRGVGEKTAAKFLAGNLKSGVKFAAIVECNEVWERNLPLVQLPFEGIGSFDVVDDKLRKTAWQLVCDDLGMSSLRDRRPGGRRRKQLRKRTEV